MKTQNLIIIISLITLTLPIFSNSKSLNIGRQPDYPPYIFTENGKTTGVCVEIVEAAFKLMEIETTYSTYPFQRMLIKGREGNVDAVLMAFKTSDREEYLSYPDYSLSYEVNVLFTKKGENIEYRGVISDLYNYNVGVIRGFSYGKNFDSSKKIIKVVTNNHESLIRMTIAGRVNIAVGCEFVIDYHADKLGLSNDIMILTPNLFSREPLYLAFSKRHPEYKELTSSFSDALKQLRNNGEIERIHKKYNLTY